MSADVYLYTGEAEHEDVKLRQEGVIGGVFLVGVGAVPAIGDGTIKVTFAISGVAATPAIGVPLCKVTFAVSGVSASPAVGILTFSVKTSVTGVAASPAIGVGTFNSNFALSGVAADAAVGVTRIDVTAMLEGVSATPEIGVGTVTTATLGDVIVALDGVGADPQIGDGTVEIEEVVAPPVIEVAGGHGRWYWPQEETVYLTGVAASPAVGKIAVYDSSQGEKLYPFPRRHIELVKPYTAPQRKVAQPVEKVPENVVVRLTGVQSASVVGTGTVKRVVDLLDDEVMGLLEMLELEEAA